MEWHDIAVDGLHTVKFTDLPYVPLTRSPQSPDTSELFFGEKLGGVLRHGEWAWLARNSVLQIVSLRNGQTISSYEFCESRGYDSCSITCVEEIYPHNSEVMLLAVILESFRGPGGGCSYVAVYSVELSSVLNCIELSLHVTCARFMDASACRRSLLQNFDGCLALGSEEGVIALLDLNIRKLMGMHNDLQEDKFVPCHIVEYSLSLTEIHRNYQQCQQDGIYFGLQMEVIESPCSIRCILPIDLILGLAIGLEDGRLALYDVAELQIFYIALPSPQVTMSALVKMDFLVPPDDPRPCLYMWALHENGENLHAVLHSFMYEKRITEENESSIYFESFQTSSVRLQLPLEATKSAVLSCQAISTFSTHGEEDSNSLCTISWLSVLEGKNKLLIFDLNQWYKDEMPFVLQYGRQPNYLAGYILNGECTGLHTLVNPNSIAHFNSMQRFEEHFYPNSLSFEALLLHTEGSRRYNWEGAQNRVINLLRSSNAAIFLEPNLYFNEIIRTRLMPQFMELNANSTFSRNAKYEILLSVALENSCMSLLRDCAKSWVDGSFMGNFAVSTGLSLSTITDWIWKRTTCIKIRCNDLCKNLFEFGGYHLDNREQKELSFITRQLKLLTDLLKEILVYAKKQIPERVFFDLENKHSSLCMASSYQDILLWLLNIGLLPEISIHCNKINDGNNLILYPYKELKEFYRNKRSFFAKINESFISKKSGSCKLLFIDSFIDHVCKGNILHEYWLENEGNGLYPPNSLEAMLRVMFVPDLHYDNKCAILLYFFLDLNMALDEEIYKDVVDNFIKFPSVFKLSAPLIKTVQAFWNLDHDHYSAAVDEFISPFNKNQCYPQWQVELLIDVLLNKNSNNLALRVLESHPSLISPLLKLNTLLANELISEAFHFVRSKNDDALLETFFTRCLCDGQFGVIRDLALSEREGLILQNILKKSKAPGAESLHFVYLLQKSKYIEAVSYMDELSNKAKSMKISLHQQASQMDTPNLVLSAFNTTMAPVTQGLTDIYFRIKNKIKKKEVDNKSPVPLSCQLIKQNANSLLGGIYHSSALSAHFATYYWGELEEQTKQAKHLLNSNNAPFLRRPQIDINCIDYMSKNNISYPQAYKINEKRTLIESGVLDMEHNDIERHKIEYKLNPKKKRRLLGQEIVDDLSHFIKMNKTLNSSKSSDFRFDHELTNEDLEQTRNNCLDLLIKPVKRDKEFEGVASSVPEIHSILKTHTAEPSQLQRETPIEEEKSLRFTLPSADVTNTETYVEAKQNEDITTEPMEIVGKEKTPEVIEKNSSFTGSPKLQHITGAVSEESNKSFDSSSNKSEENYYSPLSSQNNSKLDCSNLSRHSFLSGPQPRKPLARLSIERSEKSLTPEAKTNITDLNLINKSSHLHYATALESAFKSKISPRSSLERSSSDQMEKTITTEVFDKNGSNNTGYITARETLSKPIAFCSSSSKEEETIQTSGFDSIGSHATFASSKINEFFPTVSSSKVGTNTLKANDDNKQEYRAKLSECSTVLGSLTTFECTNTDSTGGFATPSINMIKTKQFTDTDTDKSNEDQKCQMLETTLSMSSYDFSILDTTSVQQSKSLIDTANDGTSKADENKKTDCKEELEENKDDNCIVLSSSSSSSSSPEQEENEYDDNYNDSERHDEDEVVNADNIEDDKYYEFAENNNSNIFMEDSEVDYYEEYNEEASINETDNSSDIANEDVIELLEDSLPEVSQQAANYYGDSDSDSNEVKLVESDHSHLSAENIDWPLRRREKVNKENTSKVEIEEKPKEQDNIAIISSTNAKSTSSQVSRLKVEDPISSKSSKKLSITTNNLSEVDIRIHENVSTSTTEICIESNLDALKGDNIAVLTCGGEQEEKQDLMSKKHTDTKNDSKDVISTKTEVKSSNSEENTKNTGITEAIEKPFFLRLEDSIKVENEQQLEMKSTTEEKEASIEKSDKVNETEEIGNQIENKEELKVQEAEASSTPLLTDTTAEIRSTNKERSELIIEKERIMKENEENELIKSTETENSSVSASKPLKQRTLRGSSVPPMDLELNNVGVVSSPRRNTRGMSVPPQTNIECEEFSNFNARTRRSKGGSSLQPKNNMGDIEKGTPHKHKISQTLECSETRSTRGSSLPPGQVDGKLPTRIRSVLLDAISEDPVTLDSPSSRTRLKSRLNSIDSELDYLLVSATDKLLQPKRTRRTSLSNNPNDLTLTPKRTRLNSNTSQSDTNVGLRSSSILSVQEEDSESIPPSPKPASSKRIVMKRKKSTSVEATTEGQEHIDQISPKSNQSAVSEVSYSSSRRLTRTQLAIMEKSAVLSQALIKDVVAKELGKISPPPNKRTAKSRSTRSSNANADSDDSESVSSKLSSVSSATGSKRRITRRSLKDKDDIDDDGVSVASSFDSHQRPRRSKDKSSSNPTLTVIPEDAPIETKKRGRQTKH